MAPHPVIDIGVNLTSGRFRADREQVVRRAREAGVVQMVVTGTSIPASLGAAELARAWPAVLGSTAGVHPHHASELSADSIEELRRLAVGAEVVAIGECGLDYNRNFSPPADQRRAFAAQLELAAEVAMPVFLHERDAHDDLIAIVRERREALVGGVVHCFTGTRAELDAYLALDLHIGITGWLCDERRGTHLRELVADIPADRMMIETDAPYLLPRDLASPPSNRRNEPAFLPHILAQVAACAGRPPEQVARETSATARRFFRLPAPRAVLD